MSLMNEYINRKLSGPDLESELLKLIADYNSLRKSYLFVYAAAIGKPIPTVPLEQSDFYIFRDLLSGQGNRNKVDVYLETPGGSGETAEEIAKISKAKLCRGMRPQPPRALRQAFQGISKNWRGR